MIPASTANSFVDPNSCLLPFRIVKAETIEELKLAAKVRQLAYGKHLPQFGDSLGVPDEDDRSSLCAVLLAYSKLDGSCIGTVRVQIAENKPLRLEESFILPIALRRGRIAEISRLAIPDASNGLVLRLMLIKAAYWYCRANLVERCFLCVRYPVDRQYRRFDLDDVLPHDEFVPMKHIGLIPHRILWFDVFKIESNWLMNGNPLHDAYFVKTHPDLLSDIQFRILMQESESQSRSHG